MKKRWASFLNQYKLDDQAIKLVTQAEKEISSVQIKAKVKTLPPVQVVTTTSAP